MSTKARNRKVRVFSAEGGFGVVERLFRDECELRVRMNVLQPEYDRVTGEQLGYRQAGCDALIDQDVPSLRTTASISMWEMDLNAGVVFENGRSRTLGLNEARRLERVKNGRAAEDGVERAQAKVHAWGLPTWWDRVRMVLA